MSKIGRIPVTVPQGVQVTVEKTHATVTGPKGSLTVMIPKGIVITLTEGVAQVSQVVVGQEQTKALFGLTRALLANAVTGVSKGFEKKLELAGVGYRAAATPTDLTLSLGFSHPVKIKAPVGISFSVVENVITVVGIDIAIVGNLAAHIRSIKPPEPYKGKGIKYVGEKIRKKAGKAAKAVGAGAK